ncbi:ORC ubiquitin ligase 1 isoform X2 [Pseudophryne corroboree]|uniref:ORC ubiquitin ligase 1 isoform X2 n=1 Tax=Pseudophryne corroboree TaxID=495146 RepID=UPI0030815E74
MTASGEQRLEKYRGDEIESLVKETEELKRTNLTLEQRLNELPDPVTTTSPCRCAHRQADVSSNISDKLLVEWNRKLEMVNTANQKVTGDLEKLKQENRKLKNENIEFVRENLRLKNEVDLRSPQKFGRFTVAALQAKVDQYEREISRLKKALERSDQYIEEVEAQVEQLKRPLENKQKDKPDCQNGAFMEVNVNGATNVKMGTEVNTEEPFLDCNHKTGFNLDDVNSICSTSSNGHTFGLNKAQSLNENLDSSEAKNQISDYLSMMKDSNEEIHLDKNRTRDTTDILSQVFGSPSLSQPFSSLQLNTPGSKTSCSFNHGSLKKPLTYLRKLVFDDLSEKRELGKLSSPKNEHCFIHGESTPYLPEPKSTFLNFCHDNCGPLKEDTEMPRQNPAPNSADESSVSRPNPIDCEDIKRTRTSSENSMDVAFNDKISELHYMMCDLESQKSGNHGDVSHTFKSNSKISKKSSVSHEANGPYSPCSPSANGNSEHTQFFKSPSPGENDLSNTNTVSSISSSSQPECEILFEPSSSNMVLPGHSTELAFPPSCIAQNYNNSPPAKRKMLNPCSDSPSKSLKH